MPYINVADGIPDLDRAHGRGGRAAPRTLVGAVTGLRRGPARRADRRRSARSACSRCSTWSWGRGAAATARATSRPRLPRRWSCRWPPRSSSSSGYAVFQLLLGTQHARLRVRRPVLLPTARPDRPPQPAGAAGRPAPARARRAWWSPRPGCRRDHPLRPPRPPGRLGRRLGRRMGARAHPAASPCASRSLGGIAMRSSGSCWCGCGSSRSSAASSTPSGPRATACAPSSPRRRAATSSTATASPGQEHDRREPGRAAARAAGRAPGRRCSTAWRSSIGVPASELGQGRRRRRRPPFEPVILAQNVEPRRLPTTSPQRQRDFPGSQPPTASCAVPRGPARRPGPRQTGKISPSRVDRLPPQGYQGDERRRRAASSSSTRATCGDPGAGGVRGRRRRRAPGREVSQLDARRPGPRHPALHRHANPEGAGERAGRAAAVTGAKGAAGVAIDPRTGEVLAIASYPTFDPEIFVNAGEGDRADRQGPGLPAAGPGDPGPLSGGLDVQADHGRPPPSRTASISVDEQLESPADVTLHKQVFRNFKLHSHGLITLPTALEVSSDTYFYQVGDRLWAAQDEKKLVSRCRRRRASSAWGATRGSTCPARTRPRPHAAVEAEGLRGVPVHGLPPLLEGRRHDPARRRAGVPAGDARCRWRSPTRRSRTAGRS